MQEYLKLSRGVLELEAKSLLDAAKNLTDEHFVKLQKIYTDLLGERGSLIVCGVGKSGMIAQKIASTFTSLGLPSFFLHPVEALHGDLGRVNSFDAIIFISKSGTTEEIMKLLPFLTIPTERRIGLLGNRKSPIGDQCHLVFDCSVEKEACLNNQAPTTSSTLALAVGDVMAVVFEKFVGLSREGFAQNHPGGILGKSLRLKVRDLMTPLNVCPVATAQTSFKDIVLEMTKNPVGACAILDAKNILLGIIVDGDIRRAFVKNNLSLEASASSVMNATPVFIGPDELASRALELMEKRKNQIAILPVIDEQKKFYGFIRLHDLLKEGFNLST